jgi:transcription elongation factor GreA
VSILYFTRAGADRITRQKEELVEKLKEAQLRKGEAAGAAHDWHDNADYEQAQRDEAQINGQLATINGTMSDMVVIDRVSPDTSKLRLGQIAVLEVGGETKTYLIGGYEDSDPNADPPVISYLAPLVARLIGKEEGDSIKVAIAGDMKLVTLVGIRLPD